MSHLKENSFSNKIGYIETEYFGGSGTQSAILYSKGEIVDSPKLTNTIWDDKNFKYIDQPLGEKAINSILIGLGLQKRRDIDPFDILELGKYRSNEKLIKSLHTKQYYEKTQTNF